MALPPAFRVVSSCTLHQPPCGISCSCSETLLSCSGCRGRTPTFSSCSACPTSCSESIQEVSLVRRSRPGHLLAPLGCLPSLMVVVVGEVQMLSSALARGSIFFSLFLSPPAYVGGSRSLFLRASHHFFSWIGLIPNVFFSSPEEGLPKIAPHSPAQTRCPSSRTTVPL